MADWYNRQQSGLRYEIETILERGAPVRRATQGMHLKPRVLCFPCNNNWGSKLEDRVGAILTPMIRGEDAPLSANAQQLISAWFTLKVMASEYLVPSGIRVRRFFELGDGQHLRATLRPREGVRIWIGRYVGSRASAGWTWIEVRPARSQPHRALEFFGTASPTPSDRCCCICSSHLVRSCSMSRSGTAKISIRSGTRSSGRPAIGIAPSCRFGSRQVLRSRGPLERRSMTTRSNTSRTDGSLKRRHAWTRHRRYRSRRANVSRWGRTLTAPVSTPTHSPKAAPS
jgi:hypothetical protein